MYFAGYVFVEPMEFGKASSLSEEMEGIPMLPEKEPLWPTSPFIGALYRGKGGKDFIWPLPGGEVMIDPRLTESVVPFEEAADDVRRRLEKAEFGEFLDEA